MILMVLDDEACHCPLGRGRHANDDGWVTSGHWPLTSEWTRRSGRLGTCAQQMLIEVAACRASAPDIKFCDDMTPTTGRGGVRIGTQEESEITLLHCYYYLLLQKFRFKYGCGTLYKIYIKSSTDSLLSVSRFLTVRCTVLQKRWELVSRRNTSSKEAAMVCGGKLFHSSAIHESIWLGFSRINTIILHTY